jgi:hypothetical protein
MKAACKKGSRGSIFFVIRGHKEKRYSADGEKTDDDKKRPYKTDDLNDNCCCASGKN